MKCKACKLQLPIGKDGKPVSLCRCGVWTFSAEKPPLVSLADVADESAARLNTACWWAILFGGGFVHGCVYLVGGEAGGGKSTASLQISDACVEETGLPVLYLAAEETPDKIRSRGRRIGVQHLNRIMVPAEKVSLTMDILGCPGKYSLVVLDSLTKLAGRDAIEAVSVCDRLVAYAQETNTAVIIVDHVTKGGDLGGLMTLQHNVDATSYLRVDTKTKRRTWETIKDRHGEGLISRDVIMTHDRGLILAPITEEPMDGYPSPSDDSEGKEHYQ